MLATTSQGESLFSSLLPWIGVLAVMVLVGAIVIAIARRMLDDEGSGGAAGFTLQDLRDLRDQGTLSDEEFERAKAEMIGRVRGADAGGGDDPGPGDRGPDERGPDTREPPATPDPEPDDRNDR